MKNAPRIPLRSQLDAVGIDRCRVMVDAAGLITKPTHDELAHGIPTFLDQLIETPRHSSKPWSIQGDRSLSVRNFAIGVQSDRFRRRARRPIPCTGAIYSMKDSRLQQVVSNRITRNVCQAVTKLAVRNQERRSQLKSFAPLIAVLTMQLPVRLPRTQSIIPAYKVKSDLRPQIRGPGRLRRSCGSICIPRSSP